MAPPAGASCPVAASTSTMSVGMRASRENENLITDPSAEHGPLVSTAARVHKPTSIDYELQLIPLGLPRPRASNVCASTSTSPEPPQMNVYCCDSPLAAPSVRAVDWTPPPSRQARSTATCRDPALAARSAGTRRRVGRAGRGAPTRARARRARTCTMNSTRYTYSNI